MTLSRLVNFTFLACALALASPACAQTQERRPKNFRKRHAAPAKKKAKIEKPAVKPQPREGLAAGRWDPAVKRALEDLVRAKGKTGPQYDAQKPPVAVFTWDDAAVEGDPSEAVFFRLIERVDFKYDDDFWQLVPIAYGRQQLRADYELFSNEPQSVWIKQATYQQYRKNFLMAYEDMCYKLGRKECRTFLTSLCAGFEQDDLRAYARKVVDVELAAPMETESVRLSANDTSPAAVRRGLRPVAEIKDLISFLLKSGFDVWVVSDDNQWVLEAMVKDYGIDPSRALGVKVSVDKAGRLGSVVPEPVPIRGGKVDAIVSSIGRAPTLAVGSDPWDLEMLSYGEGTRLVLDKGDRSLRAAASEGNWLVQPSFAAGLAKGQSAAHFEPDDDQPARSKLRRVPDIAPPPKTAAPEIEPAP